VLSIGLGPVHIPAGQTARAIASAVPGIGGRVDVSDIPESRREIILSLRSPRVLVGMLVGMALALSGALMQGYFQNPMADPYIIGVSSGAGLGATLAMALRLDERFLGMSSVSLFALVFGLAATFLVYGLARQGGRVPTGTLLLTGIAVGAMVTALTSLILLYGTHDLKPVIRWLMGSLSGKEWRHVLAILPYVAVGLPLGLTYARDLNALVAGDEAAKYMGVDVERTRTSLLVLSAALAASAVAVAGVIGFVGLVVPHIMRLAVGPDHRRLLPVSALAGAVLVLGADLISRMAPGFQEAPVGIVTAVLGCPFFLFLLYRSRGSRF